WESDAAGNVSAVSTSLAVTVDQAPPTAGNLVGPPLTTPASAAHTFTVTYSDNIAVDVSTLDSNDILVTGPGGYSQLGSLVSASPNSNSSSIVATYQIPAPPGGWSSAANGT